MKFLRIALCAAVAGFTSAARPRLTLPVSAQALQPFIDARAASNPQLMQLFRPVTPTDVVRVEIDANTPGISDVCYDSMLLLQQDANNGAVLDNLLTTVASQCVQIVTREAIEANDQALITTIACDVGDVIEALQNSCGELDGAVADFTVTQDITRTDRENFFVRLSADYYQCVPFGNQGCSVPEVEAVGVALASGLAASFFEAEQEFIDNIDNDGVDPVVDVQYSVTALVFGQADLVPQGIFGGGEAFVTTTTITGESRGLPNAPRAVFVRSDDLNFASDIEVLSPVGQSASSLCKNMAASMNIDALFRNSRCVADCQERRLPVAELNIWCPRAGSILIREGLPGQAPGGVAQPITSFNAADTGFTFTGSQSVAEIPAVATNGPVRVEVPAGGVTLVNGNPIIAPGAGVPIATLPGDNPDEGAGSSLKPAVMTTGFCLVLAAVSRRFC